MRLTEHQAQFIAQLAHEMAGENARVRVFGSRLDDGARGGDLDLLLAAPNLMRLPIHELAFTEGKILCEKRNWVKPA